MPIITRIHRPLRNKPHAADHEFAYPTTRSCGHTEHRGFCTDCQQYRKQVDKARSAQAKAARVAWAARKPINTNTRSK